VKVYVVEIEESWHTRDREVDAVFASLESAQAYAEPKWGVSVWEEHPLHRPMPDHALRPLIGRCWGARRGNGWVMVGEFDVVDA
jgi:hypothetical protein